MSWGTSHHLLLQAYGEGFESSDLGGKTTRRLLLGLSLHIYKKQIDGFQVLFLPLPGCCRFSTPACIHGMGTYGDVPAAGQCQADHQVGAQPGLLGPAFPEQLNLRSSEARVGSQLFIVQTGLFVSPDCSNEDIRSPWPLMLMGRGSTSSFLQLPSSGLQILEPASFIQDMG